MSVNNFKFKVTTIDDDGNSTSETVSVNVGPAASTPPTVQFSFPSGVRAEAGDDVNPYWSAGTKLATAFCKVWPTARPASGGTGRFFVQTYSNSGVYPNSPDSRFEQTFEGVGGQLTQELTSTDSNFMTVTSGIGISSSGLAQSSDLVGLRKAIHITNDASIMTGGTLTTRFGKVVRVGAREYDISNSDEGLSVYHHNLTNNRVYTLGRGGRGSGRTLRTWPVGTSVTLFPYHYTPMYSNTGAPDILVMPHILVQEEGIQYPLTGRFAVTNTAVTGEFSNLLVEVSGGGTGSYHVSGARNVIKFSDAESWYIISGVLSSSGLTIYDYGDSLSLTNQTAEVNAFTQGSGLIAIEPDLTGCGAWDVIVSPSLKDGDSVANLSITYTASVQSITTGGAISGTPSWSWEVLSGTVGVGSGPTWSGLVPGNIASQTVVYEDEVTQRIRITVSGSGQPACKHQFDSGPIAIKDAISAGTWGCIQSKVIGSSNQVESNIKFQHQGTRLTNKYYHHNLFAMKPKATKITTVTTQSATSIYVTAGTIDQWPDKGTVMIKGATPSDLQVYHRFSYTGKTNSSLTGITFLGNFSTKNNKEYDQTLLGIASNGLQAAAGNDIWIEQTQPHPFSFIEAKLSSTKLRLYDIRGIENGSINKWVRFAPVWSDTTYTSSSNPMIDQPYRITSINIAAREITLDRSLNTSIKAGMACIMQPYLDSDIGIMYPTDVSKDRLNYWNTATWFIYSKNGVSQTISSSTNSTLYIWDPMHYIVQQNSAGALRIPPVGRMIAPHSSSAKGIVFEYNGVSGPLAGNVNSVTGDRPGIFKLENVRIKTDLGNGNTTAVLGARTFLIPYQDIDLIPLGSTTFEPTDADIGFSFTGGTSKHLKWSQPIADQIFVTNSATVTTTDVSIVSVPAITNYESQHYPTWPTKALRSHPPVFINRPATEEGNVGHQSVGAINCIHYGTHIDVCDGVGDYIIMTMQEVKIGDFVKTPQGPRLVINKVGSHYGSTRIITVGDGRSVHCSDIHPIAKVGDDNEIIWTTAQLIEQGNVVMTDSGAQTVESSIGIEFSGQTIHPFYDITIEEAHQFYANGILVHNKAFKQAPDLVHRI